MLNICARNLHIDESSIENLHAEDYARNCSDALTVNLAINKILDIYQNATQSEKDVIVSHGSSFYKTCRSIEAGYSTTKSIGAGLERDARSGRIEPETKEALEEFVHILRREWDDHMRTNIAMRFLKRGAEISC